MSNKKSFKDYQFKPKEYTDISNILVFEQMIKINYLLELLKNNNYPNRKIAELFGTSESNIKRMTKHTGQCSLAMAKNIYKSLKVVIIPYSKEAVKGEV